ncbi:lanthionine synthetase LanC family protein [Amorphoplanes digitatis]|uniref:non-specific serine/threonine protein kinase n=1 Tax=Actinoplanes digitatis TaxID=1868 RepID=A0A7W7MRW1_9ACTN|nr:lanthionine synthetase LanC family protein [Actinoplanes digitatis]MBB4764691.1 putative Ser/Thr protein kinase [Actinoplanes digitatis]
MILAGQRLTIPADLMAVRARDLPPADREALGDVYDDTGVALGRRTSRRSSIFVTGPLYALLEEFRTPATVVEAIARRAAGTDQAAERILDDSFSSLMRLREIGILMTEEEAAGTGPLYRPGELLTGRPVQRCLQSYEDGDVYVVEDGATGRAVVKLARRPGDAAARRGYRREAAALRLLGAAGVPVPAVLDRAADDDGHPLLVLEHVDGRRIDHRAARLRRASLPRLVRACATMVRTLALIHDRGLLHGDVHGGNYLLTDDDAVVAVDFRHASALTRPRGRHGVPRFMDPQWAQARLTGSPQPPNSAAAEQYSMAALVYFLITGEQHYERPITAEAVEAALARGELSEEFARRSSCELSEILAVLRRALAVDPDDRWPDVAAFSAAFTAASESVTDAPGEDRTDRVKRTGRWDAYLAPARTATQVPPSAAAGGAGTAMALLAASAVTADPLLLAWADLWSEEAAAPPAEGRLDPHGGAWHGRPGVLAARVMTACALDDRIARETAIKAYLREHDRHRDGGGPADLTHGLASLVLLDAHLVTLSGGDERLRHAGAEAAGALAGRIGDAASGVGLAHGMPGHLLAALAWQSVSPEPSAATAAEHLARISAAPRRWCRPGWEATWCNGAAGLTLLFLAASRALGEPAYLADAEAAMRIALAAEPRGLDLCCGAPGRAYALGRLAHATGETSWRGLAAAEHARAAGDLHRLGPHGLAKGRAGVHAVTEGQHDERFVLPLIDALPRSTP